MHGIGAYFTFSAAETRRQHESAAAAAATASPCPPPPRAHHKYHKKNNLPATVFLSHEHDDPARPHVHHVAVVLVLVQRHLGGHVVLLPEGPCRRDAARVGAAAGGGGTPTEGSPGRRPPAPPAGMPEPERHAEVDYLGLPVFGQEYVLEAQVPGKGGGQVGG